MFNGDQSVMDVNLAREEKRGYIESNQRCEICDAPSAGNLCDYHKELRKDGEI